MTIPPGGLIAILGGGQLGRMTAMAARTMGYRVRVMDPEPACPASFVVDETIVGHGTMRRSAAACDWCRCRHSGDRADRRRRSPQVAGIAPLRPGVEPVRIIQDKTLQKAWLAENGFPSALFAWCAAKSELHDAVHALGGRVFLKIGRGGYDGRGQARIGFEAPCQRRADRGAGEALAERPAVAEQALDLDCEISVMAARTRLAKCAASRRAQSS